MVIHHRLIKFVTRSNWILLLAVSLMGLAMAPSDFTFGMIAGGLIVTVNFYLLGRTLKKALTPPYLSSHHYVLAKYYIRFIFSGIIIFVLIAGHFVHPLGLFIGLSIVVVSIMLAAMIEFKNLFSKEAV